MNGFVDPQFMRLATVVAAITYRFPEDDATGFPMALPEARKIGYGRKSLTGLLTSADKVEGLGPFESSLERDYFVLLEFDRTVLAWHPQPFKLNVPARPGKRATRYTPDVAVEYAAEPNGKELHRVELCEIKYRDELKDKWDDIRPKLKAGVRHARSQGWKFSVYTEREIRTPRLWNAKFILPYGDQGTDEEDISRLGAALKACGPCKPADLLSRAHVAIEERGRMWSVLWHMVAKGIALTDFDKQIDHQSIFWTNDRTGV